MSVRRASLYLLFCLASIGQHIPFLGLDALRVFCVLLLTAFLIMNNRLGFSINNVSRSYILLLSTWLAMGMLGCLWSYDVVASLKEVANLILGLIIVFLIYLLSSKSHAMEKNICGAWLSAYLITFVVVVWEIATGQHLDSPYILGAPEYLLNSYWVMSTFDNPNNYAGFLLLCFPFIFHIYSFCRAYVTKIIILSVIFSVPIVILLTASRGALLGFIIEVFILAYYWRGVSGSIIVSFLLAVAIWPGYILISNFYDTSVFNLYEKIYYFSESFAGDSSFGERSNLILNGLYIIYQSYGLGVGPDGFRFAVLDDSMPYRIQVPNPHNFFIEIGSQYGLIVLFLFMSFITKAVYWNIKIIRSKSRLFTDCEINKIMIAACGGYLVSTMLNSSYISQPTNWLFLGVLLSSSKLYVQHELRSRAN